MLPDHALQQYCVALCCRHRQDLERMLNCDLTQAQQQAEQVRQAQQQADQAGPSSQLLEPQQAQQAPLLEPQQAQQAQQVEPQQAQQAVPELTPKEEPSSGFFSALVSHSPALLYTDVPCLGLLLRVMLCRSFI